MQRIEGKKREDNYQKKPKKIRDRVLEREDRTQEKGDTTTIIIIVHPKTEREKKPSN